MAFPQHNPLKKKKKKVSLRDGDFSRKLRAVLLLISLSNNKCNEIANAECSYNLFIGSRLSLTNPT